MFCHHRTRRRFRYPIRWQPRPYKRTVIGSSMAPSISSAATCCPIFRLSLQLRESTKTVINPASVCLPSWLTATHLGSTFGVVLAVSVSAPTTPTYSPSMIAAWVRNRCWARRVKDWRWPINGSKWVAFGSPQGCCGRAERLLGLSLDWAASRKQFGQPIGHFQGTSFKLADMATELQAADLLVMHAARRADQGKMAPADAAHVQTVRLGNAPPGGRQRSGRSTAAWVSWRTFRLSVCGEIRASSEFGKARQRFNVTLSADRCCARLAHDAATEKEPSTPPCAPAHRIRGRRRSGIRCQGSASMADLVEQSGVSIQKDDPWGSSPVSNALRTCRSRQMRHFSRFPDVKPPNWSGSWLKSEPAALSATTAGFRELGEEGAELECDLVNAAARSRSGRTQCLWPSELRHGRTSLAIQPRRCADSLRSRYHLAIGHVVQFADL